MAKVMDIRGFCIASVVLQTIIFGSGSAITKLAYESVSPMWLMAIRFGLATLVFVIFFGPRMARGLKNARLGDWLPAALCMAVSYISCNLALDLTTATNVGFLMALPVVFTPILATIVLRRKFRLAHLPFQAAVVVGLYLLCSSGGSFTFGLGELCGLITALSLAGALVFGERGLKRMDVVTVSGTQIVVTFIASLAGALVFDKPLAVSAIEPIAWAAIVFLALASTCLTFALQNIALTRLPSSTVSMLLTGEPIFTALFSWGILGETLSTVGLIGAAIIIVCVIAETWIDERAVVPGLQEEAPVLGEVQPVFGDVSSLAPVGASTVNSLHPQGAFE